jgi:hypothetical protein
VALVSCGPSTGLATQALSRRRSALCVLRRSSTPPFGRPLDLRRTRGRFSYERPWPRCWPPSTEAPYKRSYDDGRVVWIARFRDLEGRRQYAKPRWNGGRSTFERRGDARAAIDEALERLHQSGVAEPQQIGAYFADWLFRHLRSERTNKTNLRAAGIYDADLALVAGHTVETMISVYTHPLQRSHDAIRAVIG